MKRIDFRCDDELYECMQVLAEEIKTSVHSVAELCVRQYIREVTSSNRDNPLGRKLLDTMIKHREAGTNK